MTGFSIARLVSFAMAIAVALAVPVQAFGAQEAVTPEASEAVHAASEAARSGGSGDHGPEDEAGHGDASSETSGDHSDPAATDAHAETSENAEAPASAHWPTEREPMPYEVLRSLQYLQDQAARGNQSALRVQRRLLAWFGPSLGSRAPEVWADKRNVRAVVLYVLSGGPSRPLRELFEDGVFEAHDETLIEGALAYAANEIETADAKLSSIDLAREETIFAAQINLTLAQLREAKDPNESLRLLENVMLAAPGTLLDEAALRLGVLLAENAGAREKADRYARQYFDRYAASIYSGNFRARFSAVYSDRPRGSERQTLETLADTLRLLPDDQKLGMYLSVARRALVGGNLELSGKASAEALSFEDAAPADRQRALLYEIASTLSVKEEGEIRATLAAIDDDLLHPADKALKNAALDVVDAIREPAQLASSLEATDSVLDNQTFTRATSLIEAVDNDLKSFAP